MPYFWFCWNSSGSMSSGGSARDGARTTRPSERSRERARTEPPNGGGRATRARRRADDDGQTGINVRAGKGASRHGADPSTRVDEKYVFKRRHLIRSERPSLETDELDTQMNDEPPS